MENSWFENAFGYQIYIRSFKDSDGNGIGDLNGISQKLDYLKNLGIDFIWICPFYDSPMDDNGYDIRDYKKVDKIFGTEDDLKSLVKSAHKKGIKVIIDLVLNHTSDENEWFVKSRKNIPPYSDYYIWKNGIEKNGKLLPPNNWESFFSGPTWKYDAERNQFYLKLFSAKMPDLNYENPAIYSEIEEIIRHYKNYNVDGFRVDAISHIGKDLTFSNVKKPHKNYSSFSNLTCTHTYLKKICGIFKKYKMVSMGELGGNPTKDDTLKFTSKDELDMAFTFEQNQVFSSKNKINKSKLYDTLIFKNQISSSGGSSVLFWLNHDYPRLVSKLSGELDPKNASLCLSALMYNLKGTPIIYNGEEIGMENYPFTKINQFLDVNAKMMYENSNDKEKTFEYLKENSRDNSRTTMQWNDNLFGGFSEKEPWIFTNNNYKNINVEVETNDPNSFLSNYKKIIKTRKNISNIIKNSNYKFFRKNSIIGYYIENTSEKICIIANLDKKSHIINENFSEILYSNLKIQKSKLSPYQVIISKLKK